MGPLLPLAIAVTAIAAPQRAPAALLGKLDTILTALAPALNRYPPQVKNAQEQKAVEQRWRTAAPTFENAVHSYPKDAEVFWRASDFYRMGHNVDQDGAWKKSEHYGKTATRLDPKCARAHLTLGTLYVNTDPRYAEAAEKEFKAVLALGVPATLAGAHQGLVFSYYYRGRFAEALAEADAYLQLRPSDEGMKTMKATIEKLTGKTGQPTP